MTTNNDAHIATLRELLNGCGPGASFTRSQERAALDAAISALSADRGEAVAWLHYVAGDDGDPDQALSFERDSFPLEGVAGYRTVSVTPLYAAIPPSPAESAEGARYTQDELNAEYCRGRADGFDAAPSQVSDADAKRAIEARNKCLQKYPGDAVRAMRAALEAAQPQPGRVEGMVLVPVDEIERAVKVMRYAAHPHTSPNADALAKFIAPSPTAGGDA